MNWARLRGKFRLIDGDGLSASTVKSLRLLIAGVAGGIVWSNITTGIAMTGYMKELGASDFLYGVVIALAPLFNAFQFLFSYWLERTLKRREMFILSGFAQRLIWIPFGLIPFFIPAGSAELRIWAALIMALVSSMMAPMMNVSFYSMLSDIVPMRIRGRYFATRSRVSTCVGLIIGLLVGVLLDRLPGFAGYATVFCLAGLFGTFDIATFLFMDVPPMMPSENREGMFKMLRDVLRDKPYMTTVVALSAWLFSVQLSSPYFNVYVKSVLGMSNFDIILTGQVASNLLLVLFVSRWGKAIDSYGNRPVLLLSAFLCALTPILWLRVASGMLLWVAFANGYSGGIYCAVDLTIPNLFMGQAKEKNKSMYFAVYFIFSQLFGLAFGSAAGGWVLDNLLYRVDDMNLALAGAPFTRYNALFLLSGVLRFLVVFLLLPRVSEPGSAPLSEMLKKGRDNAIQHLRLAPLGIRSWWIRKQLRRKMNARG